jgi:hypothetical protein
LVFFSRDKLLLISKVEEFNLMVELFFYALRRYKKRVKSFDLTRNLVALFETLRNIIGIVE